MLLVVSFIDLGFLRGEIAQRGSAMLGREVAVEGPIRVGLSLRPSLEMGGLRLAGSGSQGEPDLLRAGSIEVQLAVLPLLDGEIRVDRVALEGVEIQLVSDAEGKGNWMLDLPEKPVAEPKPPEAQVETGDEPATVPFIEFKEITLRDIRLTFRDLRREQTVEVVLDTVDGALPEDGSIKLHLEGTYNGEPMKADFEGGSLITLLTTAEPWPVTLTSELAGGRVSMTGLIGDPVAVDNIEFEVTAESAEPGRLGAVAGIVLPDIGSVELGAKLSKTGDIFRLADFRFQLGETRLVGEVEVDRTEKMPSLAGRFEMERFDLGPWLLAAAEASEAAKAEEPATPQETLDAAEIAARLEVIDLTTLHLPLDGLREFEAELDLRVAEVINAPLELTDMVFSLKNKDGHLAAAPLSFESGGAKLSGTFDLDWQAAEPVLALGLTAEGLDFGTIEDLLSETNRVQGQLGRFSFELVSEGATVAALLDDLDFDMRFADANLSYGHDTPGKPVPFALKEASFVLTDSRRFNVAADGSLLDVDFTASVKADQVAGFLRKQEPLTVAFAGTGAGADIKLDGSIAAEPMKQAEPVELSFSLRGKRIGDLATWIGVRKTANDPYGFSGKVTAGKESGRLEAFEANVGAIKVGADVDWQRVDGEPQAKAKIIAPLLDFEQLATLFPAAPEGKQRAKGAGALDLDIPILPTDFRLPDIDLDLRVTRVPGKLVDLNDLVLTAKLDDGRIKRSPFGFSLGKIRFVGGYAADFTGAVPRATVDLETQDLDLGRVLEQLQLASGLDARVQRVGLELTGVGATPNDLIARSQLVAEVTGGRFVLQDPNTEGTITVELSKGELRAGGEEPITLTFDGLLEGVPVKITLRGERLSNLVAGVDRAPLNIRIESGGATVEIDGSAQLPVGSGDLIFELSVEGESLSGLDELLKAALPPWGPYSLKGRLDVTQAGYDVSDLALRVGDSDLTGSIKVATAGEKPRLDIDLKTETLQLDDFEIEKEPEAEAAPAEEKSAADATKPARPEIDPKAWDDVRNILRESRAIDIYVAVEVAKVLSGQDELGNGLLKAQVVNGRLDLSPLEVTVPGGTVGLTFAVEEIQEDLGAELTVNIDGFDYGILARRLDDDTDAEGVLYSDITFDTRASSLQDLLVNANGQFNFAVFPKNIETDFIDLWAVNLMTAVLPTVDSEPQSTLNCVVARFDLRDGMMTPEVLYMDTTQIMASGKGFVNFKTEDIDIVLSPQAKRAQFFSAATPIRVQGKFDDFGAGVSAGDVFGTIIRFVTSVVYVPIARIFQTPPSPDGEETCKEAMAVPEGES